MIKNCFYRQEKINNKKKKLSETQTCTNELAKCTANQLVEKEEEIYVSKENESYHCDSYLNLLFLFAICLVIMCVSMHVFNSNPLPLTEIKIYDFKKVDKSRNLPSRGRGAISFHRVEVCTNDNNIVKINTACTCGGESCDANKYCHFNKGIYNGTNTRTCNPHPEECKCIGITDLPGTGDHCFDWYDSIPYCYVNRRSCKLKNFTVGDSVARFFDHLEIGWSDDACVCEKNETKPIASGDVCQCFNERCRGGEYCYDGGCKNSTKAPTTTPTTDPTTAPTHPTTAPSTSPSITAATVNDTQKAIDIVVNDAEKVINAVMTVAEKAIHDSNQNAGNNAQQNWGNSVNAAQEEGGNDVKKSESESISASSVNFLIGVIILFFL